MSRADDQLLTTTEGVDEGSAASSAEAPRAAGQVPAGTVTAPDDGPAPPDDLEAVTGEPAGPGQQLQAGEG